MIESFRITSPSFREEYTELTWVHRVCLFRTEINPDCLSGSISLLTDFLNRPAILSPFCTVLNDLAMEIRFKQYNSIEYAPAKQELNSILMERSSLNDSHLDTVPKHFLPHYLVAADVDLRQGRDYGSESRGFVDRFGSSKRPRSDRHEQFRLEWFHRVTSRCAFSVVFVREQMKSYRPYCSPSQGDSWLALWWATFTCPFLFCLWPVVWTVPSTVSSFTVIWPWLRSFRSSLAVM